MRAGGFGAARARATRALVAFLLLVLAAQGAASGNFYDRSRSVMELTHRTFDDYVFESNHTTVVEFYAPWCGYCQQFKGDFKKAAGLAGAFAQFAAVNCDLESNKALCAANNVKGFPTIKVFRPPKKFSQEERMFQYLVDVYSGERNANRLVDHVKGKVRNLTRKVVPSKLPAVLEAGTPSVVLVTDANMVPPTYKGLAIDFGAAVPFHYVSANSKKARDAIRDMLGTNHKLRGNSLLYVREDGTVDVYEGIMERSDMGEFLANYMVPLEGPQSERANVLMGIKQGKFKSFTQYEKMKRQKQRKVKKQASQKMDNPTEEHPVSKDEL